jgi:hypothetical protein
MKEGAFQKLPVALLQGYDGLKGIKRKWQSLDSCSVKAPLRGKRPVRTSQTRRSGGRRGTSSPTGRVRTPLSAVITGANTHEMKAAFETLDGVVVKRPAPGCYHPQHSNLLPSADSRVEKLALFIQNRRCLHPHAGFT